MFQDLDTTMINVLNDAAAPAPLAVADISFATPDRNFAPQQETVDLFLWDVKENRELRDPEFVVEKVLEGFVRRPPPLRVDCFYLVTGWPDPNLVGPAATAREHLLLSQACMWLSRFPTIPSGYLAGSLANQPFPPPTLVAQPVGGKNHWEFWTALGISPRSSFSLVVTIAVDLRKTFEGPLVTTTIAGYLQDQLASSREEWINFGGMVTDNADHPVPDAWVRLEPNMRIETTQSDGRFVFVKVRAGANYVLRARATGFAEVQRPIRVPSPTGEYNLQFP